MLYDNECMACSSNYIPAYRVSIQQVDTSVCSEVDNLSFKLHCQLMIYHFECRLSRDFPFVGRGR